MIGDVQAAVAVDKAVLTSSVAGLFYDVGGNLSAVLLEAAASDADRSTISVYRGGILVGLIA